MANVNAPLVGVTSTARTSTPSDRPVGDRTVAIGERRRPIGSSPHTTLGPAIWPRYRSKPSTMPANVAVVVEVIDLDVRQDRAVQREFEMRAVALVGLDHEPRPIRSTARRCRGR